MFHARRVGRQKREERGEHERNIQKKRGTERKAAGKVLGKSCFLEGRSLYKDFWSKASRIFSALPKKCLFICSSLLNVSHFSPSY